MKEYKREGLYCRCAALNDARYEFPSADSSNDNDLLLMADID